MGRGGNMKKRLLGAFNPNNATTVITILKGISPSIKDVININSTIRL